MKTNILLNTVNQSSILMCPQNKRIETGVFRDVLDRIYQGVLCFKI